MSEEIQDIKKRIDEIKDDLAPQVDKIRELSGVQIQIIFLVDTGSQFVSSMYSTFTPKEKFIEPLKELYAKLIEELKEP